MDEMLRVSDDETGLNEGGSKESDSQEARTDKNLEE